VLRPSRHDWPADREPRRRLDLHRLRARHDQEDNMTTHPHLTEPSLTAPRIVRCHVIDVSRRHGVNRCQSEATDPFDAVPMCVAHRVKVVEDLGRLPGITIIIETP